MRVGLRLNRKACPGGSLRAIHLPFVGIAARPDHLEPKYRRFRLLWNWRNRELSQNAQMLDVSSCNLQSHSSGWISNQLLEA